MKAVRYLVMVALAAAALRGCAYGNDLEDCANIPSEIRERILKEYPEIDGVTQLAAWWRVNCDSVIMEEYGY